MTRYRSRRDTTLPAPSVPYVSLSTSRSGRKIQSPGARPVSWSNRFRGARSRAGGDVQRSSSAQLHACENVHSIWQPSRKFSILARAGCAVRMNVSRGQRAPSPPPRGSTASSQAVMQSPVSAQPLAHAFDCFLPLRPSGQFPSTPGNHVSGAASPTPAGSAIGQTSTPPPRHRVQVSPSILSVRRASAATRNGRGFAYSTSLYFKRDPRAV